MKILLADDDDNFRLLLATVLSEAGYEVSDHADGRSALEHLQAEGADLAVLDVNMPEMSGFDVLERIRADARFRDMPVLMMTVRADAPDQVWGYESGADDYLPKPFANEVLVARVHAMERRILGEPRSAD